MTTHRPFVIAVSQATRAWASCASIPSRTASDTWSQTLSGWPSVTDSEVRRKDREELKEVATTVEDHIRPPRASPRAACYPVHNGRVWSFDEVVGRRHGAHDGPGVRSSWGGAGSARRRPLGQLRHRFV